MSEIVQYRLPPSRSYIVPGVLYSVTVQTVRHTIKDKKYAILGNSDWILCLKINCAI